MARVRTLLRRQEKDPNEIPSDMTFGKLHIQTHSRTVFLNGDIVTLSSHEFDLITEFAKNAGQILSWEYLFTTIHNRPYDGLDRTIDVRISHIRKKLGDNPEKPEKKEIKNKHLNYLKEDVSDIDKLINELLTYAEFEYKNQELEFSTGELYPLIKDILKKNVANQNTNQKKIKVVLA